MQSREMVNRLRLEEAYEKHDTYSVNPGVDRVRAMQTEQGKEACFLTDKRLSCREHYCEWRRECCRLVAVWMR